MKMKSSLIKKLLLSLTFVLSFFLGNLAVQAGDYPDRPISVVVAYNPGGATDFQARLVTMMAAHPKKIIWVSLLLLLINLARVVK